jgi:predicted transcriptional regulator
MLIHLPAVVHIAEYTSREKTAIMKWADNRKCHEIRHSLRSREESSVWRPSVHPSLRLEPSV